MGGNSLSFVNHIRERSNLRRPKCDCSLIFPRRLAGKYVAETKEPGVVRIPLSMLRLVIDFVEQVSNRLCSPGQIRLPTAERRRDAHLDGRRDVDGELC